MIKLSRDELFGLISHSARLASAILPNIDDTTIANLSAMFTAEEQHDASPVHILTRYIAVTLDKIRCNSFAVRDVKTKIPHGTNVSE